MLINRRCKNCPKNDICTNKYKTEIVTDINDLPNDVQSKITTDIKNRLLPQAEIQFKTRGIDEAIQYANSEIQDANNAIQEISKEAYNDNDLSYLDAVSEIIVYNIERKKMLQQFINDCKSKNPTQEIHKPNKQGIKLTEKQTIVFNRAIEAGLMEKNNNGYTWIHSNRKKASLAYFLEKTFAPKGIEQIPYQDLGIMFNVSRLDSALTQVYNAKKPQKWRAYIDKICSE